VLNCQCRNLQKRSDAEINVGSDNFAVSARQVTPDDADYARLWEIINRNNAKRYSVYQSRTPRPIPIFVLTPITSTTWSHKATNHHIEDIELEAPMTANVRMCIILSESSTMTDPRHPNARTDRSHRDGRDEHPMREVITAAP
jgi:hypothetical protein